MAKASKERRTIHNPAVTLGRRGGLKRAKNLTPERRTEIARQAAEARWGGRKIVEPVTD